LTRFSTAARVVADLELIMRALGIDFGERRVGLAISDPAGRLAMPLETFERQSDRSAVQRISEIVQREEIGLLVVGEPLRADGSRGSAAERAGAFARKLTEETDLPCEMVDETLTTVEARSRLREAGVDLRRHPERLDALAAQILLQEALDRRLERLE